MAVELRIVNLPAWTVIIGFIFLAGAWLIAQHFPFYGPGLSVVAPPAPLIEMVNVKLVGLSRGTKLWRLAARNVDIAQNRTVSTITGIESAELLYGGKVAARLRAGKVVYGMVSNSLSLTDGVQIVGNGGERVNCDGAFWEARTSTLESRGKVTLHTGWGDAVAESVSVNMANKELTMVKPRISTSIEEIAAGVK